MELEFIFHFIGSIVLLVVIIASFYMLRHTKGKLSEGFKLILIGHLPLLFLYVMSSGLIFYGSISFSTIKLAFLEQVASMIAAVSIFAAICLIKNWFLVPGAVKNERE